MFFYIFSNIQRSGFQKDERDRGVRERIDLLPLPHDVASKRQIEARIDVWMEERQV